MTDPAVTLRDLTVAFRLADGATYTAVERASLSVADGEFVSIVGPAGSGSILGAPLTGLNRSAGYLFQADALFPWKTAIENVAIGLETVGMPRNKAHERAQTWLARVGLAGFAERYPHMLSGGQRKRVGLAQVLIRDPKILLMDEPFGPLDAQ